LLTKTDLAEPVRRRALEARLTSEPAPVTASTVVTTPSSMR
jgi:hypothetical protein